MERTVKYGVYTYNGEEKHFSFYTSLRTIEKLNFVNLVTNVIVGENYYSILRDMIFDFNLIEVMTDVDVSDIRNAEDAVSAIEDFIQETNIVEIIKANAEYGVIEELNKAIDDNIEYRTGIHKNSVADSFNSLLNTLEKKISDIDTNSLMDMAKSLSGISEELTVDKFIEAYSNSDIFKAKYAQIMAGKDNGDGVMISSVPAVKTTKRNNKKTVAK